jgi:uncharacterized protein
MRTIAQDIDHLCRIGSLRKNIAFIALFFFLTLTFMMLGARKFLLYSFNRSILTQRFAKSEKFTGNAHLGTAGGALGIITALIAYYVGTAELLGPDDLFTLPLGRFAPRTL